MVFSFVDETEKIKDKQSKKRVIEEITKKFKKKRLRKQLHNKGLLQNYFEWEKKRDEVVVKYKLNTTCNYKWIKEETSTVVKEKKQSRLETNRKEEATDILDSKMVKQQQQQQWQVDNCDNKRILVSDHFGLKLDVDDFIESYERMQTRQSLVNLLINESLNNDNNNNENVQQLNIQIDASQQTIQQHSEQIHLLNKKLETNNFSKDFKNKILNENYKLQILQQFQKYLQTPTQQPHPNYYSAISYLLSLLSQQLNLQNFSTHFTKDFLFENNLFKFQIFECIKEKPNLILTFKGKNKKLNSETFFFNSHLDVVPVDPKQWTFSPYNATIDKNRIYSRGAQDMKNVGMAYLEAIIYLYKFGKVNDNALNSYWQPERTFHIIFVADEEIGGHDGWGCFVKSQTFKDLNIVFGLDEGLASGENESIIPIYFGEKAAIWFEIQIYGNVGHGSQFIKETSTEKLNKLLKDKIFPFREQQQVQMKIQSKNERKKKQYSTVVSINLTGLRAGHLDLNNNAEFTSFNVIPSLTTAAFDMRVPPTIDLDEIYRMIDEWSSYVNGTVKYRQKPERNEMSNVDNVYCKKFIDIIEKRMDIELTIFPAATDSRFPRENGIQVLGYSFMPNTKILLHDHNEYIDVDIYLESIVHYIAIIDELTRN
ncbi:hypothetical protein ABK040_016517 [Willaertia magna]